MSILESPIPLSDIEDVLAWVDTFKLSRGTKKINRDFSDAVLLAEILSVHYPKLVEMHNYPPRNSHSLKLNNWMTLNRKVLKKLRLNLCCNTMEQLANCTPGVIERVLLMVRDKIRRDEEVNKSLKEGEQNMSSGGSYYEACADDEHVLVVPVKTRVNGVLESIQKKVVSHEYYLGLKEELKDAKDTAEMLKQKVEHLDNLIKLKDERIEELQKQLERKQSRRKEVESSQPVTQNSISVPFESEPPTPKTEDLINIPSRPLSLKSVESTHKNTKEESKIPLKSVESIPKNAKEETKIPLKSVESIPKNAKEETKIPLKFVESIPKTAKEAKIPGAIVDANKPESKPSVNEVASKDPQEETNNVDRIKSEVFKEVEIIDQRVMEGFHFHDSLEFINESDLITGFDEIDSDLKDINFCYQDNFIN